MSQQPATLSDRSFGLVFCGLFVFIATVAWLIFDAVVLPLLWIAGGFLVTALLVPWILLPLNRLWGLFVLKFATVNNYLVLGVVMYGLFWPVGLFMRLIGRDPMDREFDPTADTYFSSVGRQNRADTMPDMF